MTTLTKNQIADFAVVKKAAEIFGCVSAPVIPFTGFSNRVTISEDVENDNGIWVDTTFNARVENATSQARLVKTAKHLIHSYITEKYSS